MLEVILLKITTMTNLGSKLPIFISGIFGTHFARVQQPHVPLPTLASTPGRRLAADGGGNRDNSGRTRAAARRVIQPVPGRRHWRPRGARGRPATASRAAAPSRRTPPPGCSRRRRRGQSIGACRRLTEVAAVGGGRVLGGPAAAHARGLVCWAVPAGRRLLGASGAGARRPGGCADTVAALARSAAVSPSLSRARVGLPSR